MVTAIVFFDLPPGTDRAAALALYRRSAHQWLANPDLIEKYYFIDEERGLGGGIYVSHSREGAARWHGDDYRQMVRSVYGAEPRIEILDALMHVDPATGTLAEL
jgi:hypothetical protein